MPYPHFEESDAYDDALDERRREGYRPTCPACREDSPTYYRHCAGCMERKRINNDRSEQA